MLAIIALLLGTFTRADQMPTVYSCKEQKIASFDWSEGGLLSNPGIEGNVEGPGKKPTTITLVVTGKKAMFKGNNGESPLERLDEVTFLERPSAGGNIIMWKLIPASAKVPTLLVQFKGYQIATSPYIHAWVFKCD